MPLEFLLGVPVLCVLAWTVARIIAARAEAAEVQSGSADVANPRSVPLAGERRWQVGAVGYLLACVFSALAALSALEMVVWGFATDPSSNSLIPIAFAIFAVSGTVAALLIWQARAALVVPGRLRQLRRECGADVFATTVSPSLRRFLGDAAVKRRRELYVSVNDDVSLWLATGDCLVECARLPAQRIVSARLLGLPRTAGVDEVALQVRAGDDRTTRINFRPFTRAYDQSRAQTRFLAALRAARSRVGES